MIKSKESLKEQNKVVLAHMGIFMMIIGAILLIPLITIFFYPEDISHAHTFIIPAVISAGIGYPLSKLADVNKSKNLSLGQDSVIVVGVWVLATVFCALPFVIAGELNFTQAYFEAVSGWTTTGLSVVNVEEIANIFLIHRSVMSFFGGVGIVLIMVSALSATFGMKLYSSEGHSDKLMPNLLKSSRLILSIYSGYVIAGIILYCMFGMPLFDAINHSIAALSTGGFSVKAKSIGYYDSFAIELITIILMLLGTTNFAAHVLLIQGKLKKFFQVGEVRFMFVLLGISIPMMAFFGLNGMYGGSATELRVAMFEVVSALSTTGFSVVSYVDWSSFAVFLMIVLMIIGGGAGSTAGGLKLYRVYLLVKRLIWNLRKQFMPEHMVNEDYIYKPEGKMYIKESDMSEVTNYASIYMVMYAIGVMIIAAHGYTLQESLFEFASSLGTVGLSIGVTSPTAPPLVLWTESFGMLFGRLEIWVIFIAMIKITKDIKISYKQGKKQA